MRRRASGALLALLALLPAAGAAHAATSIYLGPAELAGSAPLVVEGTVKRVASGYDPVTGALATYVTLTVRTVPRGPKDLHEVVLRELGGRFGELALEVDAVPLYRVGEHVVVFAEPGRDGALRTAGMFFGKYTILDDGGGRPRALRDLTGRGRILRRPPEVLEEMPLDDLERVLSSAPYRGRAPGAWKKAPPELARLSWREESDLAPAPDPGQPVLPEFALLSSSAPTRWEEADSSLAVSVDVERARNPLGDGAAAVAEIRRAAASWTNLPEARVVLRTGNEDASFSAASAASPARVYPASNIVLFGDPYDDLADPVGCAGTLAIGGYWRSTTRGRTVNGVRFYPARRLYVIFNRGFECFLGDPANLAEIATHELGHGIGLGHSSAPDSIMRAWAYGNRGSVLGGDDRDAAHCLYPHAFTVLAPNGGETWTAASSRLVTWRASAEAGPDAGLVDLELSTDAGASWLPIARGEPNDGSYAWSVPRAVTTQARIRVLRPNRTPPTALPFPAACSQDASNASFSILPGGLRAGRVPEGAAGEAPLVLGKRAGGSVALAWGGSCGAPSAYAVYEGTLGGLRAGAWDHVPLSCASGFAQTQEILPGEGDRYYLVSAVQNGSEGSLGTMSSGLERPASSLACGARDAGVCP